jgi:hypothetical protein
VAPPGADPRLVRAALRQLGPPGKGVGKVDKEAAAHPGLYALYASEHTWRELGLGRPANRRPLYVGKAENTLASRDLQGHFGMRERGKQSPTGGSTVRRSLAALLANARGYRGMPRNPDSPAHFSNYGLSVADDDDLSTWMRRRIRISLWPHDDAAALDAIETAVLKRLVPPLNLNKVETPWRKQVKDSRAVLADQARTWSTQGGRARSGGTA